MLSPLRLRFKASALCQYSGNGQTCVLVWLRQIGARSSVPLDTEESDSSQPDPLLSEVGVLQVDGGMQPAHWQPGIFVV